MGLTVVEVLERSKQGRTEPYLCRCDDDAVYFVKGPRATRRGLVAEWVCARLATELGLPIAPYAIAEVPDGPPRHFRWRGNSYRIIRQEGPERITSEWWRRTSGHADNPGLTRDYYRVEDEVGHRFWLFRHGLYERETTTPRWYIHGVFA